MTKKHYKTGKQLMQGSFAAVAKQLSHRPLRVNLNGALSSGFSRKKR